MASSLEVLSHGVASIHQNVSMNSIDGITSNEMTHSDYDRNLTWLKDDFKLHKAVVVNVKKWDLCGQFIME